MRGSRIFVGGGGGPGQSDKKKALTTFFFFFSPQLILQRSNGQFLRNLSFFKVPEGVQHFQGGSNFLQGGGVQLLIPYRNPYNLWFSRGVRTPCPPLLDPHLGCSVLIDVTSINVNCKSWRDFDVNCELFIFKNVDVIGKLFIFQDVDVMEIWHSYRKYARHSTG